MLLLAQSRKFHRSTFPINHLSVSRCAQLRIFSARDIMMASGTKDGLLSFVKGARWNYTAAAHEYEKWSAAIIVDRVLIAFPAFKTIISLTSFMDALCADWKISLSPKISYIQISVYHFFKLYSLNLKIANKNNFDMETKNCLFQQTKKFNIKRFGFLFILPLNHTWRFYCCLTSFFLHFLSSKFIVFKVQIWWE